MDVNLISFTPKAKEGIMIFNFQPSNAYLRMKSKIPNDLRNYKLIVIHYATNEFTCDKWTTRTRDIIKKRAKMLQFDSCHAYLMEPSRFENFVDKLNKSNLNLTFPFLAYRFVGDKWISTVDLFSFSDVNFVECYNCGD